MDEYNKDFEALTNLERNPELFTDSELQELRLLLGLYGVENEQRAPQGINFEKLLARHQYWADVRARARNVIRSAIADRAETHYGRLLFEIKDSRG